MSLGYRNTPEPDDQGLITWNGDWGTMGNATALPTAGTEYLARVELQDSALLSAGCAVITVAGAVLTAGQCFVGLRDATGRLVAVSADASAAMMAAGLLAKPYLVPFLGAAGYYYVSLLFNGTTGPTLLAGAGLTAGGISVGNAGLTAGTARWGSIASGTSLAAQINLAAISMNVPATWAVGLK